MPARQGRPPLIIIGAPRSGTTMVTRMLEALGLFLGKAKSVMDEARFFQTINRWIIFQSGGRWDFPGPMQFFWEHQEARQLTVDYVRFLLGTPRVISFLGWWNYLRFRTPSALTIPWGWKCPYSTVTLPAWLEIFPDAKVFHILRHGVDMAESLKVRVPLPLQRKWLRRLYYGLTPLHWIRPKQGNFVQSVRCATLEGGFSLWEEYVTLARQHVRPLQDRALELKYEDFLSNPEDALRSLVRFCDLPASPGAISRVAGQVKKERAYAYRDKPELQAFADRVADRLRVQGYQP